MNLVEETATLREAWESLNISQLGIALIVDKNGKLLDTLTDGDFRRAILEGKSTELPVCELRKRRIGTSFPDPITAPAGTDTATILGLMREYQIIQVPLIDHEGKVTNLVHMKDLVGDGDEPLTAVETPLTAVIMAGGFGSRLLPLTKEIPKPMLPVGNKPLLERIVCQLRDSGIKRIYISTHYLADQITNHFGDGHAFGVEISYLYEDSPLGTAGAIGLMEAPETPVLVMYADLLTGINFNRMLEYHLEHEAKITVAARCYQIKVPFGVLQTDGALVTTIAEKPSYEYLVNAGIYILSPEVVRSVKAGQRTDMTDLMTRIIEKNERVVSFPIIEHWRDVGALADYQEANAELAVIEDRR